MKGLTMIMIEDIPPEGLEVKFKKEKMDWETKKEGFIAVSLASQL
jgi:hypothetical protein